MLAPFLELPDHSTKRINRLATLMNQERSSVLHPTSRNEFVFHYTSRQAALEHIVPSMWIRFGKYTNTNDPRETKQWTREHFVGSVSPTVPRDQFWNHVGPAFDRIRPFSDRLRVLCMTKDSDDPATDPPELRGFGLSRMWAQYGGNHGGVCLAFHRANLQCSINRTLGADEKLLKGNVDYKVLQHEYERGRGARAYEFTATSNPDRDFTQHAVEHQRKLFFKKSTNWESEREYRWLYIAQPGESDSCVDIRNSLAAIFLGVDFPRVYLPLLSIPCRKFEVGVFQMHIYRDHLDCPERIGFDEEARHPHQ